MSGLSRASRELALFGAALIIGLIPMPLLIWFVGNRTLGPYTHGADASHSGPMVLLGDFYKGLAHGWISYWLVALGPIFLILLVRVIILLLRRRPQPAPPAH